MMQLLNFTDGVFTIPEIIYLICMVLIGVCILTVLLAVFIDFLEFHKQKNTKKEKKSIVETGTMILFFLFFYLAIRLNVGILSYSNMNIRLILLITGTLTILFGSYINIIGRFSLGKNWSNQIKIYKKHTLVTRFPYNIVRHPLYASLIWMFYAASIIYLNYLAFLLNTLIFLPMMYYRAKQEEELLKKQFKNYNNYKTNVGMFIPKIKWKKKPNRIMK